MEIQVYLHRTKKKNFEVCERFSVVIDFDKLPEDKREDVNFINLGFKNDAQRLARQTKSIQKYGTGYVSFLRPQYEGPEEENGTDKIYFDNKEMIFLPRPPKKKTRKKKEVEVNDS